MRTLKYVTAFILCILFGVSLSYAQVPGTGSSSAGNQQETARLERQYEVQLKRALANYYNKDSFLIDANIELEEVKVPKEFRRSTERQEPIGLDQLPGLPVLPPDFTRTVDEDTVKPNQYATALQIRQKTIRAVVDTSYSFDDISFVEELVRSEANLDEARGDIVTVDQRAFPRSKNELMAEKKPEPQQQAQPVDTVQQDTTNEQAEEAGFFRLNNPDLLRYIIYGLIAFVLILAIALFLSARNKRKEDEIQEAQGANNQQAFDELKAEIQSLKEDPDEEDEEPEITPERRALFEKDRAYITNQYISNPQKVANLLERWITNDPEEGVLKAAKAVKGGNEKLLTTLRPVLNREHFDTLQYSLEDMNPMSPLEQMEQARQFRQKLQEISGSEEKADDESDLFDFMGQLSDDQVLHLLKDETDRMIAIALAQLKGDRSANILERLDEDRRTSILVKMGNIDDLSIDAYKEVANHFSEKALKIINMKRVAADGVQSILQLIDTLPVGQQEQYVESIEKSDLKLAQKVRKYFVGFSDIPDVEDHVLEEVLNEFETETLITALIGADDEIYEEIMAYRPKREQQLIKSEIETRTDVEKSDIDDARKKLLREIRNKTTRD